MGACDKSDGVASQCTSCTVVDHPLVRTKFAALCAHAHEPALFRQLSGELATLLAYEATAGLRTSAEGAAPERVAERVAIVPVMRGGLGIAGSLMAMLPDAPVLHVGVFCERTTGQPVEYYNRLPSGRVFDVVYVLDAQVKTGATSAAVVDMVKEMAGPPRIVFVTLAASAAGVDALHKAHPDVRIYAAGLEPEGSAAICDATDRMFGVA